MAISMKSFVERLHEKSHITDEERSAFSISKEQITFKINKREFSLVRLRPDGRGALGEPDAVFPEEADPAPHWSGDSPDCMDNPPSFDLKQFQTGPKDQLDRATCLSFACLAGMESLLLRDHGMHKDLSEQFTNWMIDEKNCDDKISSNLAAQKLVSSGVCEEDFWGYVDRQAVTKDCGAMPSDLAKKNAIYRIRKPRKLRRLPLDGGLSGPSIGNSDYLECLLLHKHPVVFVTAVGWGTKAANGAYDVRLDSNGTGDKPFRVKDGAHAMLLIGYDRTSEPRYFIFKNSLGTSDSPDGLTKLTYDYIRAHALFGFFFEEVVIDPIDP